MQEQKPLISAYKLYMADEMEKAAMVGCGTREPRRGGEDVPQCCVARSQKCIAKREYEKNEQYYW